MSGPHPQQQHDSHFAHFRLQNEKANKWHCILSGGRLNLRVTPQQKVASAAESRTLTHFAGAKRTRARHKTHSLKLFSQACRAINFHCSPLSSPSSALSLLVKKPCASCVRQFWKSAFKTHMCAARRRLLFHSICILSEGRGDCHRSSALPGLACCCRSHASLKSL